MFDPTTLPDTLQLHQLEAAQARVADHVIETPSIQWPEGQLLDAIAAETEVWAKLELFQQAGTFKPRGAMNAMLGLPPEVLRRGVTAVSAGNHAIATAYCASRLGVDAHVFMPKTARRHRIAKAEALGAHVTLCDTQSEMFERAETLQRSEGRTFIHPFEGPLTLQGTAGVGLEISKQMPRLDALLLPVGGGGLAGGTGAALKQIWPETTIIGVEPQGANTMMLSLQRGETMQRESVSSIADSLCPPKTEPFSFSVCQAVLDDVVVVDDAALRDAMGVILADAKLAVEPAAAATIAALKGPLREPLGGKRVGVICCGTNMSLDDFLEVMAVTA